ncbi:MAG: ABC transporter permease [Vulcanimicrobiaceae bacterium]
MKLDAYIQEAFSVLAANRVRTVLTALGLVIGVTAVVAIQVLGAGMSGAVTGILGGMSDRSFIVIANVQQADFTRAAIRLSDLQRLHLAVPNIVDALPLGGGRERAQYGDVTPRLSIGPVADARFASSTPLRYGRKIDLDDVVAARHVAVLSDEAASKLGITGDPTGTSLRLGEHRYVIVGVLGKSTRGIVPSIADAQVSIPYTTYEQEYTRGHAIAIFNVLLEDASQVASTEGAVLDWLHTLKGGRVRYQTFDRKTFGKAIDGVFTGVTVIVALIGAVSLLVAGIGVLNIMLVSVAERTREIGLRKAIGATRFQILLQFFIEAFALSSLGCVTGMLLGIGIGALVDNVAIVKISGVVTPIPWLLSLIITIGFATIVTLAFGTYPAWRAANLDPIEALRYE